MPAAVDAEEDSDGGVEHGLAAGGRGCRERAEWRREEGGDGGGVGRRRRGRVEL